MPIRPPHRPARAQFTHAVPQTEQQLPLHTVQWGCGDTIGELGVSLVYRTHRNTLPDVAFPSVGRLGLTSPPATVLCNATTASWPFRGPSLVARSPIPCVLLSFVVSPQGSWAGRSAQPAPGPLVTRSPSPGCSSRSQRALPSSRFPLWTHAPLSDPGGVLGTRQSAPRTAAFRPLKTVG